MVAKKGSFAIHHIHCNECGVDIYTNTGFETDEMIWLLIKAHLADPLAVYHGGGVVNMSFIRDDKNKSGFLALVSGA